MKEDKFEGMREGIQGKGGRLQEEGCKGRQAGWSKVEREDEEVLR